MPQEAGNAGQTGDAKASGSEGDAKQPKTEVQVYSGDCLDCALELQQQGFNPVVLSEPRFARAQR